MNDINESHVKTIQEIVVSHYPDQDILIRRAVTQIHKT